MIAMCSFKREFFPEIAAKTCPAPAGGGGGDPWCTYDNHLLTLVISSLYLSAFFACFVAADLARRFGRRVRRVPHRRAQRGRARLHTTARLTGAAGLRAAWPLRRLRARGRLDVPLSWPQEGRPGMRRWVACEVMRNTTCLQMR